MEDCPTSAKTGAWKTWTEANRALKSIRRKDSRNNNPMPNHVYRCRCRMFHLTSDTTDKERAKTRRRKRERERDL